MIRFYAIVTLLLLGHLFTLNRSNQAKHEAYIEEMKLKAELHRSERETETQRLHAEHEARLERLRSETEANVERKRLVDQLRAWDAKQGK